MLVQSSVWHIHLEWTVPLKCIWLKWINKAEKTELSVTSSRFTTFAKISVCRYPECKRFVSASFIFKRASLINSPGHLKQINSLMPNEQHDYYRFNFRAVWCILTSFNTKTTNTLIRHQVLRRLILVCLYAYIKYTRYLDCMYRLSIWQ